MDSGRRLGLRARLIVANSAVVLILGFFIVTVLGRAYTGHWLAELRRSWVILAGHFSEDVVDHILTGDELMLKAEVAEHTESLREEAYIVVADEHNCILAHSFDHGIPADLRLLSRETLGRHSTTEVILSGERIYDVGVPVLGGSIGTVHIGFAEEKMHRDTERFVFHMAAAAACALVLQMLVSVLLLVRITKPILNLRSLAEQVRRIGRGMVTVPVRMSGTDEVAEVASAYNTMREEVLVYERRLRSLASQLSLAEERQRRQIASQLHDHIGQATLAVGMKLGALSKKASDAQMLRDIEEARGLIDEVVKETRSLAFEVNPPVLTELGLIPALEWLATRMKERYDLSVTFTKDRNEAGLGDDLRALLFQCTQELLMNVVKHAEAKEATLSVVASGGRLTIEVSDDGAGFDADSVLSRAKDAGGFGLFSIRERLSFLQCEFSVRSSRGEGTTARIAVPPEAREADEKSR